MGKLKIDQFVQELNRRTSITEGIVSTSNLTRRLGIQDSDDRVSAINNLIIDIEPKMSLINKGCECKTSVVTSSMIHSVYVSENIEPVLLEFTIKNGWKAHTEILGFPIKNLSGPHHIDRGPSVIYFDTTSPVIIYHDHDTEFKQVQYSQEPITRPLSAYIDMARVAVYGDPTYSIMHVIYKAKSDDAMEPKVMHTQLMYSDELYNMNTSTPYEITICEHADSIKTPYEHYSNFHQS